MRKSRQERPHSFHPDAAPQALGPSSALPAFLLASAIVFGVAALVAAGMAAGKWTFAEISRDPSAQFGFPLYGGFVSTLGFAGWTIAATASALAATARPQLRRLMLPVFLLSALLALDDQFMLHDAVLPRFGIPEKLALLLYGVLCLRALWPFLPDLLRLKLPLLAIALASFVFSLLIDNVISFDTGAALFLEDTAKFIGIVFWATHWFGQSAQALGGPAPR